ncbi:MAG TPA: class I SAM-dependent methyltransferase [Anaerolineae bacterium]|jgi:ubiquinone/menaquinone biosynthesis C-methylase UbiE
MPIQSVSFDRAAGFYDDSRGLPAEVSAQVGRCAADLVGAGGSVLEIGIGTGRIAKPLMAHGLHLSGIDLSRAMMNRLLESLPECGPVPHLAQADATAIPLCSGLFDAVVAVHVFHLIHDWHAALAEVQRVLKPAGCVLIGHNATPDDSPYRRIRNQWEAFVEARGTSMDHPAASQVDYIKTALIEAGLRRTEVVAAKWSTRHTVRRVIDDIENRIWSQTWQVPEALIPPTVAELRLWALGEFGSLDYEYELANTFVWEQYSH